MARKREEKASREDKEQKAQAYLYHDQSYQTFSHQLAKIGMQLRDVPGDGNCLFRALGDQLIGHGRDHYIHRADTVKYMCEHRHDFEPFVVDDIPFERYVANLRTLGTYGGNDALVAFARYYQVNIVIHQLGSPVWTVKGTDNLEARELHISYHNGDHYSSVRRLGDNTESPADIRLKSFTINKSADHMSGYEPEVDYDEQDSSDFSDYDNVDHTEAVAMKYTSAGSSDGVARVVQNQDDIIDKIVERTGCQDRTLVTKVLEECFFNMDEAEERIYKLTGKQKPANGLWSASGTGSRIHGPLPTSSSTSNTGARPKSKSVKKEKKLLKKKRAEERHRMKARGENPDVYPLQSGHCHNDTHLITEKVGMLLI